MLNSFLCANISHAKSYSLQLIFQHHRLDANVIYRRLISGEGSSVLLPSFQCMFGNSISIRLLQGSHHKMWIPRSP